MRLLPTSLMVRLIRSNQRLGRTISVVDNEPCDGYDPIQGAVVLDPNNIMHKMMVGAQRHYVSDVAAFVNATTLSIKVDLIPSNTR